ncbi:transposase [Undibacterium arcticum]
MQSHRTPYPAEFRRKMIELVQAGRSPEELAEEFEPTAQTIYTWVAQAERDAGKRHDGLTSVEREELNRLKREKSPAQDGAGDTGKKRPGLHGRPKRCPTRVS